MMGQLNYHPPCAVLRSPAHPLSRLLSRLPDVPNTNPSVLCRDLLPHVAGTDLLSGFGGEPAAATAGGGGDLSDMLTMSPGDPGSSGNNNGDGAARKTVTGAGGDDWLGLGGLAGNGQTAAKTNAVPAGGSGSGSGSGGAAKASSGSLLDDWAGGGARGKEAAGAGSVDRSQMLQQKVIFSTQQQCGVCVCAM